MVYVVLAALFVSIFPIFVNFNLFFDINKNRCFYGVYLYKIIKIYSGYFELNASGIIFHLSETQAQILPYKNIVESGKKFEITKGFEIIRLRQIFEYGSQTDLEVPIYVCSMLQVLTSAVIGVKKSQKPFLNIKSTNVLVEGQDCAKVSLNMVAVFNLIVLIIAGVKTILEKIYKYVKRKQQN